MHLGLITTQDCYNYYSLGVGGGVYVCVSGSMGEEEGLQYLVKNNTKGGAGNCTGTLM